MCSVEGCDTKARARGLCNKHYLRAWSAGVLDQVAPLPSCVERFWSKVDKTGEYWVWMAGRDRLGYGRFGNSDRLAPAASSVLAHRIAYEWLVGSIPEGLTLDHLCRNTSCVNPAHLEPVTNLENLQRGNLGYNKYKTHCKNGHPFDEENTAVYYGKRACRTCRRIWGREGERRRRELAKGN